MSQSSRYRQELLGYSNSYAQALDHPSEEELKRVRTVVAGRDLVSVGSGGATPAATLAAQLHIDHTGRNARSLTPLLFLQEHQQVRDEVVLVLSAQARHPDTWAVIDAARSSGRQVVVVSQRSQADLDPLGQGIAVLQILQDEGRDGFLATRSLIAMCTAVARIYDPTSLPSSLPDPIDISTITLGERLLVLYGRDEQAAAEDIEVRLLELGLAAVQLADYRTLAHGRHTGLARMAANTTVIGLKSPSSMGIAEKTLGALPQNLDVNEIATTYEGIAARIHLLASVSALPTSLADKENVNPSKPKVPDFGRTLYHLPFKRTIPSHPAGPVSRKLEALEVPLSNTRVRRIVDDCYAEWASSMSKQRFETVVCDYDGTVVDTVDRFHLPTTDVQAQITRLLSHGARFVFASGRGASLYESLRQWVPEEYWTQISLGLHNGTWSVDLSDELCPSESPPISDRVHAAVTSLAGELGPGVSVRDKPTQISIESLSTDLSTAALHGLVEAQLGRQGLLHDVVAVRSAHSVDVALAPGKLKVLAELPDIDRTLIVGDEGREPGNDARLLGATRWSVSVDRCSPALDRCWNTSTGAVTGASALVAVLRHLSATTEPGRLAWSRERNIR